ncbi:MAG TPA: magnesium transporter, partial [Candidatus Woesearchaeota archaeon]|nr:magnesium transporter [Candidatus Woesearchaeota archaeon]
MKKKTAQPNQNIVKKDKQASFQHLPENKQGFYILSQPKRIQKEIMDKLSDRKLVRILNYLDPDEATDILQNINQKKRKNILKKLGKEIRNKIEFLIKFDPRTAAGMMSLDYVEVDKNINFEQLSRISKKHERRTGKFPTILAVKDGFLQGELPPHVLALAKRKERISKHIKKVPSIKYNKKETEIVAAFKKHPHNKIVVLDENKGIL